MPRCPFCDHVNLADARYCSQCGAETSAENNDAMADDAQPSPDELLEGVENPLDRQLLPLLAADRKIEAVKIYREATGVGLKEAKDSVEALAEKAGLRASRQAGCSTSVVLGAVLFATSTAIDYSFF